MISFFFSFHFVVVIVFFSSPPLSNIRVQVEFIKCHIRNKILNIMVYMYACAKGANAHPLAVYFSIIMHYEQWIFIAISSARTHINAQVNLTNFPISWSFPILRIFRFLVVVFTFVVVVDVCCCDCFLLLLLCVLALWRVVQFINYLNIINGQWKSGDEEADEEEQKMGRKKGTQK